MHVAIDGVGNHVGGGWTVLRRTVREVAADARVERLTVFCSPLAACASQPAPHPKVQWVEHPREHANRAARLAWLSLGFDVGVERAQADVAISMNGVGRTTAPRICLVQQAFAVHGALRSIRPRGLAAKLAVVRRETARSVRKAEVVVVQTTWMQQCVAQQLETDAVVLPLGVPRARDANDAASPAQVLSFASPLPYKNTKLIADALAGMTNVEHVVMNDAAPAAVQHALQSVGALVVASEVESFGLPVVEAFANGCPVVCADRAWAHAVGGNAPRYFAHNSTRCLRNAVADVLASDERRAELQARGAARLAELWADEPYTQLVDIAESLCGS